MEENESLLYILSSFTLNEHSTIYTSVVSVYSLEFSDCAQLL
jgi:hypothetical protein